MVHQRCLQGAEVVEPLHPSLICHQASLVAKTVKNLHARWEAWVWFLGRKIPWRRKWHPTPVFLPGKSHGQRSLVGYSPWGYKESDTTEWLILTPSAAGCRLSWEGCALSDMALCSWGQTLMAGTNPPLKGTLSMSTRIHTGGGEGDSQRWALPGTGAPILASRALKLMKYVQLILIWPCSYPWPGEIWDIQVTYVDCTFL